MSDVAAVRRVRAVLSGLPHRRSRDAVLLLVTGLAVGGVFLGLPALAQDPAYHVFADSRRFLAVPNFANVVSNLAFLIVGAFGIARGRDVAPALRPAYRMLCLAAVLVSLGSAGYHLAPANATLLWDRLPIAVGLPAVLAMVIGDRVSQRAGRWTLWLLAAAGVASVLYWYAGEIHGRGDLRAYLVVQGLPLLLIPILLLAYPGALLDARWLWAMLVVYALAKLAEHHDAGLYEALGLLSGHTCKHLLAALAVLFAVLSAPRGGTRAPR